jgi:N-acetylneuraminic acid mutarotase
MSAIEARPEAARVFQTLENVILAGGADTSVVRCTLADGEPVIEALPDLPMAFDNPGAAVAGNDLFVAGGTTLLKLNLNAPEDGWISCASLPEAAAGRPVLVSLNGTLYVTGLGTSGTGIGVYNPVRDEWFSRSAAPETLSGAVGVPCGDAHLLFFNTARPDDGILAYHQNYR